MMDIRKKLDTIGLPEHLMVSMRGGGGGDAGGLRGSWWPWRLATLLVMILASLFESLIHPLTIPITLPLAAIGSSSACSSPAGLSVPALVGAIMLVGIVVNNRIVLVDCINQLRFPRLRSAAGHRGRIGNKGASCTDDDLDHRCRLDSLGPEAMGKELNASPLATVLVGG